MMTVKNLTDLAAIRKKINNAFSEEGKEAADALRALLDELENAEVEIDEEEFAAKVTEIIENVLKGAEPNSKTEEAIANAINKRFKALQNSVNKDLPINIKNQICGLILAASGSSATEIRNNVEGQINDLLVKNGITGLTFENVVDYTIATKWADHNPLYKMLHQTKFSKFFYTTDLETAKAVMAKGWLKANAATIDKVIQEITATGKTITTQYVYARQQAALEDLDDVREAGQETAFINWLNEELDLMLIDTIILAILIGDTTNDTANRVTSFETIGTKTASDAFTYVQKITADSVTLKDLRTMADKIYNPNGKKKVLCIRQDTLTSIEEFTYASGGSLSYRTNEEIAKMIGVDEIYTTDLLAATSSAAANAPYAIIFLPDGYWVKEKNYVSIAYPYWEKNRMNYQKERNIGGKIHDLMSSAVLEKA